MAGRPFRFCHTIRRTASTATRTRERAGLPGRSSFVLGLTSKYGGCLSSQSSVPEQYASTLPGSLSPPTNSMHASGVMSRRPPSVEGRPVVPMLPTPGESTRSHLAGLTASNSGFPLSCGEAAASCQLTSWPPTTRVPSAKPALYRTGSAALASGTIAAMAADRKARALKYTGIGKVCGQGPTRRERKRSQNSPLCNTWRVFPHSIVRIWSRPRFGYTSAIVRPNACLRPRSTDRGVRKEGRLGRWI